MRTSLVSLVILLTGLPSLLAQQDDPTPEPKSLQTIPELEAAVHRLDRNTRDTAKKLAEYDATLQIATYVALGAAGAFLLLSGVFCSVWAQDHGRSGVLWFILGLVPVLHVFTLLIVLVLNPSKKNYSPGS